MAIHYCMRAARYLQYTLSQRFRAVRVHLAAVGETVVSFPSRRDLEYLLHLTPKGNQQEPNDA